ncbi:hypothetical protein FQA39_LY15607 [Lamprigera yunnana]|nr:hypothetical protein FQA39_LY15607 [Lamprigera yunnana]
MNRKSIKVRNGVKTFLDKAKSRNGPLYLGTIMTFDTHSCENNTVEAGEVEQSIDLPWSIPEDYDANNKARLLKYGNAAEETLINSTCYDLDNQGMLGSIETVTSGITERHSRRDQGSNPYVDIVYEVQTAIKNDLVKG